LVADDEPDNAELLQALLQQRGHHVDVVHDGVGVLRSLEASPEVDVVFLDLGLPRMDGFEVAKAVRERLGSTIRIVAVTGFGGDEYRQRAHRVGFNAILIKPFPIEDVDQLMRAFAGGKD
jgi:CheY-like chemotaxis protein